MSWNRAHKLYQVSRYVGDKMAETSEAMKEANIVMKTFLAILWMPGGVGILGLMLMLDKDEEFKFRVIGALMALLLSPFMLLTFLGLCASELSDKVKQRLK